MANNETRLNTRLLLRYDSYENWMAKKPVLLAGEVAVATIKTTDAQGYNTALNHQSINLPQVLIKVGDGTTAYDLLPFASALAADVHPWAKETELQFENRVKGLVAGLKFASAADLDALEALVGPISNIANSYANGYNLGPVESTTEAIANLNSKVKADIDGRVGNVADIAGSYNSGYNLGPAQSTTEAIVSLNITAKTEIDKKADAEATTNALYGKVDKVDGHSLVSDAEIARLADVDNYNDAEVRGLISDNATAIADLETYIGTIPATATAKDIVGYVQEKTAGIATEGAMTELGNRITAVEGDVATIKGDYLKAADIANFETKDNVKKVADDLAAYKTANDAAVALKADKSVVDAMYTNAQIDGFIADAKKYADDNDADTKYGITYDSDAKKIKLVEGGTTLEIDATDFIKDGMIENVTIGDDNDLVITFNTDAGKQDIKLPLDQLVDIYTGVEGDRIHVTVNADKSISADLVAGSIGKDYLDDAVKASLAKADSALQEHQSLENLATKAELKAVSDVADAARTEAEVDDQIDAKIEALDLANTYDAKGAAATAESNAKGHADGLNTAMDTRVKALEENKADYATKAEAQGYATAAQTAAETKVNTLANGAVAANTAAIAAINNTESGILAQAKKHTNDEIAKLSATDGALTLLDKRVKANEDKLAGVTGTVLEAINAAKAGIATTAAAGLVKASEAITVDSEGVLGIAKVSTDVLFNGEKEFVLFGGTANGFNN